MKNLKMFFVFILCVIFVLGFKSVINKTNVEIEKITFVAASETMGDGKDPATMDYFQGVQYPHLSLILPSLKKKAQVEVVDWKDTSIDWSEKRKVILGPVWGYTKDVNRFISWLDALEKNKVTIVNNTKFLKWNINKKYLVNLQENNIKTPNTLIISAEEKTSFDEAVDLFYKKFHNKDIIIKGVIDAGAFGYLHIQPKDLDLARQHFDKLKRNNQGVVMQNFLPEVYKQGELAFVFIDGKISHFFIKVAKYNEERVQPFYGGKSFHFKKGKISDQIDQIKTSFRKDLDVREKDIQQAYDQAELIYSKLLITLNRLQIPSPKYLRMDGIMINSQFIIMELEGIEPYLEMQEAMDNDPQNNLIEKYIDCLIDE